MEPQTPSQESQQAQPPVQPVQPTPMPPNIAPIPQAPRKKNVKAMIIAALLAIILVGGGFAYYKLTHTPKYLLKKECKIAYDLGIEPDTYKALSKYYDVVKDSKLIAEEQKVGLCSHALLDVFAEQFPTTQDRQKYIAEANSFIEKYKNGNANAIDESFAEVNAKARDLERKTDISALHTYLEVYYNDHVSYPPLSKLTQSDEALESTFKGLDAIVFHAPGQDKNSYVDTSTPTKDQYGYKAFEADGKTACKKDACSKYVLYYYNETEKTVKSKESLN